MGAHTRGSFCLIGSSLGGQKTNQTVYCFLKIIAVRLIRCACFIMDGQLKRIQLKYHKKQRIIQNPNIRSFYKHKKKTVYYTFFLRCPKQFLNASLLFFEIMASPLNCCTDLKIYPLSSCIRRELTYYTSFYLSSLYRFIWVFIK